MNKKSLDEQFNEIDGIVADLTENYPDIHFLLVMKEDDGTKRSIVGNYCLVCAKDQLVQYVSINNIQHNGSDEQKNIVPEVSKLKH